MQASLRAGRSGAANGGDTAPSGRSAWGGAGGLFAYGNAPFFGSISAAIPGRPLNAPIVAIERLGAVLR